jgi:hypothetical protein
MLLIFYLAFPAFFRRGKNRLCEKKNSWEEVLSSLNGILKQNPLFLQISH